MKKLLLILLCLPMIGFGQQTYVPDAQFENYLEANGMGNGIANDDYVTTASIDTVTKFTYYATSSTNIIIDFTGIEAFIDLIEFSASPIYSIDVSNNIALTNKP